MPHRGFQLLAIIVIIGGSIGILVKFALGEYKKDQKELGLERVEVEQVDGNDLDAVKEWAKGICRGVTVAEAAEFLSVKPSMATVVETLTEGLPDDTREVAVEVCERELIDDG